MREHHNFYTTFFLFRISKWALRLMMCKSEFDYIYVFKEMPIRSWKWKKLHFWGALLAALFITSKFPSTSKFTTTIQQIAIELAGLRFCILDYNRHISTKLNKQHVSPGWVMPFPSCLTTLMSRSSWSLTQLHYLQKYLYSKVWTSIVFLWP